MPATNPTEPSEPNRFLDVALLRTRDQRVVVGLALAALALLGLFRLRDVAAGRTIVDFGELERREVRFSLDLNRADVAELAELPNIGPTVARRIVDHRRANGPFRSIDDLDGIEGIGPKTLEAIRPHVRITAK